MTRKRFEDSLELPWRRDELIRFLATGELTKKELAARYDCGTTAIDAFVKRHHSRIDDVKNDLQNEFAGLWAAKKVRRIAVYEDLIETLTKDAKARGVDAQLTRAILTAQRNIAEELGDLPVRATVDVNASIDTRLQIAGLDPNEDV